MGQFAVGQRVPRFEDPRLLRGNGRYVDDMVLPGMAFGRILRSRYAHARIRGIDTARAEAAPGVIAVFTGSDWAESGFGDLPVPDGLRRADGSPAFRPRYPALARDRVRWVGECVAFVVAATEWQAADAAELIEVAYEPLPATVSTADAMDEGAPRVWDESPRNICFVERVGDAAAVEAAFARADHVIRERFLINRVTAATLEPRGCIGDYGDGRYTLYTTLQRAHPLRSDLARTVLKVPESRVRVVAGDIGGSFGMKGQLSAEMALVLLASKRTSRPVKWTATRTEAFLGDPQGRDNVTEAEFALDRDGTFLGLRVRTVAAVGAYLLPGMPSFVHNAGSLAGVYRTPAIHADVTAVFTHTNPVRPYRGNGRPEAAYVLERLVDMAADALGIDPVELRRRNLIPADAMPYKAGLTFTYDSGAFEQTLDRALRIADYAGFEARRETARRRGKLRGIGVSLTVEQAAVPSFEAAEIRFDRSGTATLFAGSIAQGQGHETVFKQIVCDRLGLDPHDVHYVHGDTDRVFFGEGTGGSRSATIGGSAFHMATEKIVAKATLISAHLLEVDAADLRFAEGVFSSSKTNRTLSIADIAVAAVNPAHLPAGMEAGLAATAVYQAAVQNFPNGCHVCELEIDGETGTVEILHYVVVDDVGTVLNPLLLEGQIHGGVAQAAGQILLENICFDTTGELMTASFMDYALPRAGDLCAVVSESKAVPTRTNPLGVKGAGEAGTVGAVPAVANALVDALSVLSIPHIEMPATPERIWRAIQSARNNGPQQGS